MPCVAASAVGSDAGAGVWPWPLPLPWPPPLCPEPWLFDFGAGFGGFVAVCLAWPRPGFGFFACVADLEDELIRALGTSAVERVLDAQAELASFRRFQAMPQHRGEATHRQLHRFLGTRATRKIRSARRLVEALDLARLPRPLAQLAGRLLEAAALQRPR